MIGRPWTSRFIVRVAVGVVFMFHGAGKVFGWFGGPGLAQMMLPPNAAEPTKGGMGPVLGSLISIGECFGGLGIAIGFLSRFSALANIVIMGGAIAMVHGKNGFSLQHGGFEYNWARSVCSRQFSLLARGSFRLDDSCHCRSGRAAIGL